MRAASGMPFATFAQYAHFITARTAGNIVIIVNQEIIVAFFTTAQLALSHFRIILTQAPQFSDPKNENCRQPDLQI